MTAPPVGYYHAIVLPVALQYLVQHDIIVAIVLVFIQIVGTHDAPGTGLGNGSLEGRQINFVQGSVADDDIHLMAILLVVVQGIVLHAGCHALRLQTFYIRYDHARGQQRVLTHILEIPTSERGAVDIHARAKDHALAPIKGLLAETLTIETSHVRIPRRSQTGQCREGHARVVRLSCLFPFVP